MSGPRYCDLVFDESLVFARRGGKELRFTRQERAVLDVFIRNPRKLLTRAQILDTISHNGSDISDRNVDFLINRLRGKLGDSAREPRFIATRYGEGYVWIAEAGGNLEAFLVIGPCRGLGDGATALSAQPFLADLERALKQSAAEGQTVAFAPHWQRGEQNNVRFSLDISFHDDGALHAACVLRDGGDGRTLRIFRETICAGEAGAAAERIRHEIWSELVAPAPASPEAAPLELRMHDAAFVLSGAAESWREIEKQIEIACAAAPDDPALAIMRAMGLYARLIQSMPPTPPEQWSATEDEIECSVLANIPHLHDQPVLKLGAAKLLLFIDRDHLDLAERLTREAFEQSAAFAASFAMQAQIKTCRGDFADAIALYDKAIELAEEGGGDFLLYLLVLKATALLAAGERGPLETVCSRIYEIKPLARMQLGLVLSDPLEDLPPDLAALLSAFDGVRARMACDFFYRTSARHFIERRHGANVMRGLLSRLVPRFGEEIVPAPLRRFDFTRMPA